MNPKRHLLLALSLLLVGAALLPTPALAADGERIFYASHRKIWSMSPDGTGRRLVIDHPGPNREVELSPDGGLLAFSCKRQTSWEICISNRGGSGIERLTMDGNYDPAPSWSPDSSQLVFQSCLDAVCELAIMNVEGTDRRTLTRLTTAGNPDWSPDGSLIAFTVGSFARSDIFVVQPDGEGLRDVNPDSDNPELQPRWSPDGTKFTYWSLSRIFVMNADGTDSHAITPDSELHSFHLPDWSPDGSKLCFSGYRHYERDDGSITPEYSSVYTARLDGSGLRRLIDGNKRDYHSCNWQPG